MATQGVVILAERFPMLFFAADADRWLQSINPMRLLAQFKQRRIARFETRRIPSARLDLTKEGNFAVVFSDCKDRNFEHDAFVLGHEIGHTFHFNLTKTPPCSLINSDSPQFFYYDGRGKWDGCYVEDFCDAFAEQWLLRNGRYLVVRACKNQYSSLRGYNTSVDPAGVLAS